MSGPHYSGCTDPAEDLGRPVGLRSLTNRLNYLNFSAGEILVNLKPAGSDHVVTLAAHPGPFKDGQLVCTWRSAEGVPENLTRYRLQDVLIADDLSLLRWIPQLVSIDNHGLVLRLPEMAREIRTRSSKRYVCSQVRVQLLQDGMAFHGRLLTFTPSFFQVELSVESPGSFRWINPDTSGVVVFLKGEQTLYSGPCRFVKKSTGQRTCTVLLAPLLNRIQRFRPKHYRSERQVLHPAPQLCFRHPLTDQDVELKIKDLSGSGFSVLEKKEHGLLMTGLVLPDAELVLGNGLRMSCQAQVVYQRVLGSRREDLTLAGLTFLDMSQANHVRLMGVLQQAWDENAYLCSAVDPDALWQFFFDSGFITPEKYLLIQQQKDAYRQNYQKLYSDNPEIARHFIYRSEGQILGHMAMLRLYENSWMIQHHAAIKHEIKSAAIMVLRQIGRSINESYSLSSAHMNYVFSYFDAENRFSERVFGGVARYYKNPQGCSQDILAGFQFRQNYNRPWDLDEPWTLARTEPADLDELEEFYQRTSGGLMLKALDLDGEFLDSVTIQEAFKRCGLRRERHVYSLKKENVLKAVILVNLADAGLSFSELTNSLNVIVVDQQGTTRETLNLMLSLLSVRFGLNDPAVLMYPAAYAEQNGFPVEKQYRLWVLNCQETDPYFEFCERVFPKT
ncbi:MAG: PilZ domain-containing protein [Desulfuromonas sp.]|nr:MAG: PilZ domain-containing protein [Desulfuromonas sp.]